MILFLFISFYSINRWYLEQNTISLQADKNQKYNKKVSKTWYKHQAKAL